MQLNSIQRNPMHVTHLVGAHPWPKTSLLYKSYHLNFGDWSPQRTWTISMIWVSVTFRKVFVVAKIILSFSLPMGSPPRPAQSPGLCSLNWVKGSLGFREFESLTQIWFSIGGLSALSSPISRALWGICRQQEPEYIESQTFSLYGME